MPILRKIIEEFRPNGGSSMKDALNRLENNQILNQTRYRMMIKQMGLACLKLMQKESVSGFHPKLAEMAEMDDDKFWEMDG